MATKDIEKKDITGLANTTNRKDAEYDLVDALLSAAEYKTADENLTEAEIKRNGKVLFTVTVHPVSDQDTRFARKKATVYMKNPNGRGLPPIEKEFDNSKFKSWLIYIASTENTQEKIWGNLAIMQKYNLQERWESIDVLLTVGEKNKLFEVITDISGLNDDDEVVDEENFQQSAD